MSKKLSEKMQVLELYSKPAFFQIILNAVTRQTQKMDLDLAFEIEGNVVDLMFKHKSYDKPFSKN